MRQPNLSLFSSNLNSSYTLWSFSLASAGKCLIQRKISTTILCPMLSVAAEMSRGKLSAFLPTSSSATSFWKISSTPSFELPLLLLTRLVTRTLRK